MVLEGLELSAPMMKECCASDNGTDPNFVCTLQISRSGGHSLAAIIWAWLLNGLNLADAGLHVLYMALFAMQLL